MQLDRELIDGTGHFRALRFVFLQLSPNFVRVSERARVWLFRLRHGRLLAAFLAGQIHSSGGPIRDQRRFAALTMKENVRISRDFTERTFRRFHKDYRAEAMPPQERKSQITTIQVPGKLQLPKSKMRRGLGSLDIEYWAFFGVWDFVLGFSDRLCAALTRLAEVLRGRL